MTRREISSSALSVFVTDWNLIHGGKVLDNFYAPTRYANGQPEGAPFEHYGPLQSEEAIRHAGEIIDFVRLQLARKRPG